MNIKLEINELIKENKWDKALHTINAIDLSSTKDVEFLFLCAKVYEKSYYFTEANILLSKAFALDPNNYDIALSLSKVSIEVLDLENAKKLITKLVKQYPDKYEPLELLYDLHLITEKDPIKAIEILEKLKSVEYNEKHGYELAKSYWIAGDKDKCISECNRFINYFRFGNMVDQTRQLLSDVASEKTYTDTKPTPKLEEKNNNSSSQNFKPKFRHKTNNHNKKTIKHAQNNTNSIKLPPEIEKEFDGLIGMDGVKEQLLKFINMSLLDKKRGLSGSSNASNTQGYHFMLLGNPGTGKTTVARIIGKVLNMIEIRESDTFIEVDKSGLVGKYIGHTEENVSDIIAQAQGGTLFIDEAYTLYDKDNPRDFGRDALNVIMKSMEDFRDSFSIILAGYSNQMYEMLEANIGLKSRINYTINIADYSDEILLEIADIVAEEKALIISPSGKTAIKERINRERIDEKFGNARFIRSLINEAYNNLANRLATANHSYEEMFKLEAIDFGVNLEKTPEEKIQYALKELNELTGLNKVKTEIKSIVNTMNVMREMANRGIGNENIDFGTLHMMFLGNPGTGKTTVARIIGQIYKSLGILKRGDVFIECSRADLVGEYQGHTGPKTKNKINEALGGILFIDEAYDLYKGENDVFGKEAITTLIAEMENNRDKLMVILAGYENEMSSLLNSNSGFKSRINTEIHFEDFSVDELTNIFVGMTNKENLYIDIGVLDEVKILLSNKMKDKDFGNARGVRNIVQNIIRNKNNRIAKEMANKKILKEDDFLTIIKSDIF